MKLNLCWGESFKESVLVSTCQSEKECFEYINERLEKAKFKSYYFRTWVIEDSPSHQVKCVDYGSHVNFFFIVNTYSSE